MSHVWAALLRILDTPTSAMWDVPVRGLRALERAGYLTLGDVLAVRRSFGG